jgi:hypothetical protein
MTEKKQDNRVVNLKWLSLDKNDKAVIVRAAKELPSMARIFLYGETRPGSREETDALLAYNDELKEPLFVETFGHTIRMTRYDNNVARWTVPFPEYQRAWRSEEAYIGLSELDDELEFTCAALLRVRESTEGHICYPYQKHIKPSPAWEQGRDLNCMCLGAFLVFHKTMFMDIVTTKYFAALPQGWFENLGLRILDDEEQELALSAWKKESKALTNSELKALAIFEDNTQRLSNKRRQA